MSSRSRRHRRAGAARQAAAQKVAAAACPGTGEELVSRCPEETPQTHEEIAVRAMEIWEQRGRPLGQDLEIWLAAEAETFGHET